MQQEPPSQAYITGEGERGPVIHKHVAKAYGLPDKNKNKLKMYYTVWGWLKVPPNKKGENNKKK